MPEELNLQILLLRLFLSPSQLSLRQIDPSDGVASFGEFDGMPARSAADIDDL